MPPLFWQITHLKNISNDVLSVLVYCCSLLLPLLFIIPRMCEYEVHMLCIIVRSSPAAEGIFSRFRLQGTQRVGRYYTTYVWAPGELRGTCSGRSKWHQQVLLPGVSFRLATAAYIGAVETPVWFFSLCCLALSCCTNNPQSFVRVVGTVKKQPRCKLFRLGKATDGASVCMHMFACVCCECIVYYRTQNNQRAVYSFLLYTSSHSAVQPLTQHTAAVQKQRYNGGRALSSCLRDRFSRCLYVVGTQQEI